MNNTKISITYIIDMIGWAGAQTHLISVLQNIDYNKFDVSVICLRRAGTKFDVLNKLPVITLVCNLENLMNPVKTMVTCYKLKKFLIERNTDILHSYMFNPNLMASMISWLPRKKFKLITTRRDTGYWHQKHHWWLYKFMNIVTDKIIAVSSEVRSQSIKMENIAPDKIITIYNGIDTEIYKENAADRVNARNIFNLKEGEFVIGILAALRPEKRHDMFIEAASMVVNKIPNVKFMIVGDGGKSTIKKINDMIIKYELKNKIILTGKVNNVIPVLLCFDISILCSDTEGMSNTVIQSLSMGKATIVTNVGGNPEVIENNLNGVLIPAGDAEELANSMVELYNNTNKKIRLEKNAVKTATEKFNIFPIISSLQDVYFELVTSTN